jgi:hypothetical protein
MPSATRGIASEPPSPSAELDDPAIASCRRFPFPSQG